MASKSSMLWASWLKRFSELQPRFSFSFQKVKDKVNYFLPILIQNLILFLENTRGSSSFVANSRKVGSTQMTPRNFWDVLSLPQPPSPLQFNCAMQQRPAPNQTGGMTAAVTCQQWRSILRHHCPLSTDPCWGKGQRNRGKPWTATDMMTQFTAVQSSCQSCLSPGLKKMPGEITVWLGAPDRLL